MKEQIGVKIVFLACYFFGLAIFPVQAQEKVQTYRTEYDGKVTVFAKNPNYYPVTVSADIEVINLENPPVERGPVLIRPNSVVRLADLTVMNRNLPRSAKVVLTTGYGNPFARHSEDAVYLLPSGTETEAVISQGTGDQKTHAPRDRYAIDFKIEENSPVYAARSGVVSHIKETGEHGGVSELYDEDANFIMILHDDDTLAIYAHLVQNGVTVEPGERVEAGSLIGYSGNTGRSHSPHLHFMVIVPTIDGSYQTLETPFVTQQGTVSELKTGHTYLPAVNP